MEPNFTFYIDHSESQKGDVGSNLEVQEVTTYIFLKIGTMGRGFYFLHLPFFYSCTSIKESKIKDKNVATRKPVNSIHFEHNHQEWLENIYEHV